MNRTEQVYKYISELVEELEHITRVRCGKLMSELEMSWSSVWRHLSALRDQGVIWFKRDGANVLIERLISRIDDREIDRDDREIDRDDREIDRDDREIDRDDREIDRDDSTSGTKGKTTAINSAMDDTSTKDQLVSNDNNQEVISGELIALGINSNLAVQIAASHTLGHIQDLIEEWRELKGVGILNSVGALAHRLRNGYWPVKNIEGVRREKEERGRWNRIILGAEESAAELAEESAAELAEESAAELAEESAAELAEGVLWDKILPELQLQNPGCRDYLRSSRQMSETDEAIVVEVAGYTIDWLRARVQRLANQIASIISGSRVEVVWVARE